jgi:transcriptional regulator with XRE-family HTH domain
VPQKNLVKSVGKAIAAQRRLAGLTQVQLADKLQIEKESVSRIETGAVAPSLLRLEQIAGALGCPVRRFFLHQSGDERMQADVIADMIHHLPAGNRELVVKFVADVVRVLGAH